MVAMSDIGVLREAYGRFGRTGPEFEGWLSNHGPMAVEAMVRHGHGAAVDRRIDRHQARLEGASAVGPPGDSRCRTSR